MSYKSHYISSGATGAEQLLRIEAALDAGQKWIQFRFKTATSVARWQTATEVKRLCQNYHATLIINDHVDLALEVEADGVHLGLSDTSISEARQRLGSKIIGGTANTFEDVLQRHQEGCDYIGLGPLRFTQTKTALSPILGFTGYQAILQKMQDQNLKIPIIAIGGISIDDLPLLLDLGVSGIAFSSLLNQAKNKQLLVQKIYSTLL